MNIYQLKIIRPEQLPFSPYSASPSRTNRSYPSYAPPHPDEEAEDRGVSHDDVDVGRAGGERGLDVLLAHRKMRIGDATRSTEREEVLDGPPKR
jgi:hypothetical protein